MDMGGFAGGIVRPLRARLARAIHHHMIRKSEAAVRIHYARPWQSTHTTRNGTSR